MSQLIVWLAVGCTTGWVVSRVAQAGTPSTLLNLVSGMLGAWVAGWMMLPVLGVSILPQANFVFSWTSCLVAMVGALMLLTLVHLLRPDSPR